MKKEKKQFSFKRKKIVEVFFVAENLGENFSRKTKKSGSWKFGSRVLRGGSFLFFGNINSHVMILSPRRECVCVSERERERERERESLLTKLDCQKVIFLTRIQSSKVWLEAKVHYRCLLQSPLARTPRPPRPSPSRRLLGDIFQVSWLVRFKNSQRSCQNQLITN